MTIDWNKYPNFSESEFNCKHTGTNKMRPEFLERLQMIRDTFNKPMTITSGYRSPQHPIEVEKDKAGEHTFGVAADIAVRGVDAMDLIVIAYGLGIRRIGVSQSGYSRFIHLGMGDCFGLDFPQSIWSY